MKIVLVLCMMAVLIHTLYYHYYYRYFICTDYNMKIVLVLCMMVVLITLYDNGQEDHITVNQMIPLLGMIITLLIILYV